MNLTIQITKIQGEARKPGASDWHGASDLAENNYGMATIEVIAK